jgi:MFS family permease
VAGPEADAPSANEHVRARTLLRERAVAVLLSLQFLSSTGSAVITTALGWQAYARMQDPLVLGLIGLSEFVPAALLALPAGHAADRHDRRYVLAIGESILALAAVGLAIDAALGDTNVLPLYGFALVAGIGQAYSAPATNPLLAASVPGRHLAQVIAMSSSTWQTASIVGPALAGLLQLVGNPAPYIAAAAGLVASTSLAFAVPRAVGVAHVAEAAEDASFGDVLAGIRLIRAAPALLGAISLDLVAVLFGGVTALLPVFSSDILHVGAFGNGVLRAAPGVGAVAMGVFLAGRPIRRRAGATLFTAVAIYGAFTVLFGLSRSFVLSLVALMGLAAADMVSVLLRGTLVPLFTPAALRGRVGAVERVFVGASNELGAFESGVAAALIGAAPAVILGGLASIVVAAAWAWRFPVLRRVDRLADIEPVSA